MLKEYSLEQEYSEKLLVRINHTHEMGTSGNDPNPARPHLWMSLPWEESLGSFGTPIRESWGWPYLRKGPVFL